MSREGFFARGAQNDKDAGCLTLSLAVVLRQMKVLPNGSRCFKIRGYRMDFYLGLGRAPIRKLPQFLKVKIKLTQEVGRV